MKPACCLLVLPVKLDLGFHREGDGRIPFRKPKLTPIGFTAVKTVTFRSVFVHCPLESPVNRTLRCRQRCQRAFALQRCPGWRSMPRRGGQEGRKLAAGAHEAFPCQIPLPKRLIFGSKPRFRLHFRLLAARPDRIAPAKNGGAAAAASWGGPFGSLHSLRVTPRGHPQASCANISPYSAGFFP